MLDDDDDVYVSAWPNRLICDVLREMRDLLGPTDMRSGAKDTFRSMIEEAQSMANRMEARLTDYKEGKQFYAIRKKCAKDIKILKKEIKNLQKTKEIELESQGYLPEDLDSPEE